MLDLNGAVSAELQRYIDEAIASHGSVHDAVAAYMADNPHDPGLTTEQVEEIVRAAVESLPEQPIIDIAQAVQDAIAEMDLPSGNVDPILSNPVTHGADPTMTVDSGPAFLKAAESTGRIMLPVDGKFLIDSTVVLPMRSVFKGYSFSHFGSGYAQIYRGPNIPADQPMFSNVYWIEGVSFKGNGNGGIGIDVEGYCCRVISCSFDGFETAITCPAGTHNLFKNNQITSCTNGILNTEPAGEQATCLSFIHNHFHYVVNPIAYAGIFLFNGRFRDNVFERVSGEGIRLGYMRECTVDNNWFEHRNGGTEGQSTFTFDQSNQCWGNVVMTSHVQAGWVDYFAHDPADANGMAGGVYLNSDTVQITNRVDGGARLDRTGLYGLISLYGDYRRPFNIKAGNSREGHQSLHLETGSNMALIAARGVDLMGQGATGEFGRALRFVTGDVRQDVTQDDGTVVSQLVRYRGHSLEATRGRWGRVLPGLNGKCGLAGNQEAAGREAYGIMTVPIRMLVRTDGRGWGTEAFESVTQTETGSLLFENSAFQIENALLEVTVDDLGIEYDGATWLDEEVSGLNRYARCFELHFYNRATGEPAAPASVGVTLSVVNSSDQ